MHAIRQMSLHGVRVAHQLIQPLINRTPIMKSSALSRAASTSDLKINFFFRCENLQKSGSFKFRGAANFIAQQSDENLRKGLVAISTGNFGQAVALAAKTAAESRSLPINTFVVLPETSAPANIAGAKRSGAKIILAGSSPQDGEVAAEKIIQDTGATFVGPMDDPWIVLGQATATLELMDQVRDMNGETLDAVVLPSATGGLLTGAAIVCQDTGTMVLGCEPREGGPDLKRGIASGIIPKPRNQNTVADGLRASISKGNFDLVPQKNLVAGFYTVTEREIKEARRLLMEQLKLVVEPSSTVPMALISFNEEVREMLAREKSHWNIGIVLTGGNTTVSRIAEELGSLERAKCLACDHQTRRQNSSDSWVGNLVLKNIELLIGCK